MIERGRIDTTNTHIQDRSSSGLLHAAHLLACCMPLIFWLGACRSSSGLVHAYPYNVTELI